MNVDACWHQLMLRLMELEFICVELNLFLDTHPQDERALADFVVASEELLEAKHEFEAAHHPLLNYGLGHVSDGWNWVCDPWPWEVNWQRRK